MTDVPRESPRSILFQFVIFPLGIVCVAVIIFLLFGKLATEEHTIPDYLNAIRSGSAHERWQVASAELIRILSLDPTAVIEPVELPSLQVTLVGLDQPLDDLIPVGLTNRPELAAQQALVQATLQRLRQEKLRPLIPSVLIRGASTPVTGTLAGGYFGGGPNDRLADFKGRMDLEGRLLRAR